MGEIAMRLLSNDPFDINKYCGHLIVTYLAIDEDEVKDFLQVLRDKGYHFIENRIHLHRVLRASYVSEMEELLADCGCYLLCLTSHFDDPPRRALRNHIWYQIGVLEASHPGTVLPYQFEGGKHVDLAHAPLHRPHVIRTPEELPSIFNGRFRSTLARCDFYEDAELNRSVRLRLGYTKLVVSLDIMEESFQKTLEKYNSKNTAVDQEGFLRLLRDNLSCGARLLGFGTENRITTHLAPYRKEMHTVQTMDYPINFSCKHVYKNDNENPDRMGEYRLEIILPIHRLLGVNFKIFLQGNNNLKINYLEMLFSPNFTAQSDVVKVQGSQKMYFSLDFPNKEEFPVDPALGIGTVADYLFPQ
jgi:hypothetical protein